MKCNPRAGRRFGWQLHCGASILVLTRQRLFPPLPTMRRFAFTLALLALATPLQAADAVTFERDVQPILTRYGCNAGACHGKARGQNGFQLSLLAYDHDFDFNAITTEARGRRVFPANPAFSLLLRKASGQVPHGGGKKLPEGSAGVQDAARRGSRAGTPRTPADAPKLTKISRFAEQQADDVQGDATTHGDRPLHRRHHARRDAPRAVLVERERVRSGRCARAR